MLDETTPHDTWVLTALGLDMNAALGAERQEHAEQAASSVGAAASADNRKQPENAQQAWAASRSEAIKSLKALEDAIRGMNDPLSAPAIILVKSISANLTASPSSKQDFAELRSYLQGDDVIDDAEQPNGFGIEIKLRAPLLAALGQLEQAASSITERQGRE